MRGVSRASLGQARERFDRVAREVDRAALAEEFFAVLHLLDREHGLRRALSDPARPGEQKADVLRILLEGKVSTATLELVGEVVKLRWARPGDLSDAVEQLAVLAEIGTAETEERLDDTEDELFRFGRIVAGEPLLRSALADPAAPADSKRQLLATLLEGKATAATLRLVTEVAIHPRGRSLERGLDYYAKLVADYRQRLTAVVRTAVPLTAEHKSRLEEAISAAYGRQVHMNIEIDPSVVGGVSVRIGDEVIDGSIAARLHEVRQRLASGL